MLDVTLALVKGVHLSRVNIQAQDRDARTSELERQRQANVTKTNNSNFHFLSTGSTEPFIIACPRDSRVQDCPSALFLQEIGGNCNTIAYTRPVGYESSPSGSC